MKKILLGAMLLSFGSLFAQETTATLAWDYPMSQLWWEWTQGGSAQLGDMNNDGNFDLLISNQDKTVLYEYNNGWYGTDSKIFDGLNDLKAGDIQWLDYNNDGYLDFIIVACTDKSNVTTTSSVSLYKNINGTSFEKDEANSAVLAVAKVYVPTDARQFHRVACGDFNNDGWIDVVVSGQPADGYDHWRLTRLFWNNQGTFAADESGAIEQLNNNGTYVADLDSDGYMDFISGGYSDSAGKQVVDVYFSNGDKTFEKLTLDHGCEAGNLLIMDANNDGYAEIFVSGYGTDNGVFMFLNNGDRSFTFKSNSEIGLPDSGDGAWGWASCRAYMVAGDLNNDGYNDIVTQCTWDGSNQTTNILLNNGDCTFTRDTNHRNLAVREGGVSIFDYNHDGKLDIHAYGWGDDASANPYTDAGNWFNNIMVNAGEYMPYTAPVMGKATYEQVEGNVVLSWEAATDAITGDKGIRYNVYAKNKETGMVMMVAPANIETGALKYTNHGSFLIATTYTFVGLNAAEYEFGVQAINNGNVASKFTRCYPTEQAFNPTWDYPMSQLWWEWTQGGSAQLGDMNNDGNFDLLISNQDKTVLYEYNNGWYGTDSKIFDGLNDLKAGDIQWLDYNNDGYLDFIIVACTDKSNVTTTSSVSLYKNINGTSFEKDEANSAVLAVAKVYVPTDARQFHRVACGDFNNDGWIDVVVSGQPADGYDHWRLTRLFWNNQGTFAADESGAIEQLNNNGTYVADLDSDGYMDFISGGYSDSAGKQVVDVYFSNGDKTFEKLTLDHGCEAGNLLIMDANNDGYAEIFVSGYGTDNGVFMFLNNGDRSFTFKSNSEIGLPDSGDGAWGWASCRAYMVAGDLNNDGYNDIVTQCTWDGSNQTTNILLNNGDCTFTRDTNHRNLAVREGGVSIFDYNHDGKLDIHAYGWGDDASANPYTDAGNWFNNIMVNASEYMPYTAPVMGKATYQQVGDDVKLTWEAAVDGITGTDGIRYNVYAKSKITGEVMMVAPANIETGALKYTNHGSFLSATTYTFKDMIANSYDFGIQAINNGNVASMFITPEYYSSVESVKENAAVKVYTFGGELYLNNSTEAVEYAVYAVNGVRVAGGTLAAGASAQVRLAKGIYIVKAGANVVKVVL